MSEQPTTVTYSLEDILLRLEQKIDQRFEQVDRRFKQIDRKFEQIDRKFEQLEEKFDQKFDQLEEKFDQKFEQLEEKFDQKFEHLEKRVNSQSEAIATIQGTLQAQQISMQAIPELTEKVGELKNWKQLGLVIITAGISSVFTGTIGGVIGWLIRGGNLSP